MPPVYLDYNATTPLDPRVLEAMMPWLTQGAYNAGSRTHLFGQQAKEAVDRARQEVASLLGARPEEIVFTSGATESNNLALLGLAAYGAKHGRRHILSTPIEHKAVLGPLERLASLGFDVEFVPVTPGGYVSTEAVMERVRQDTLMVSVMHANNETGVLQPVDEIGRLLGKGDVFFHIDAAQTYGKEVEALRAVAYDSLALSGHKIYGPQGIGALHVRHRKRERRSIEGIMSGGGQERGLRPGTLPVAQVVGVGAAAALAGSEHHRRQVQERNVRDQFLRGLATVEHVINGDVERMQPHVLNVSFPGVDSEALMMEVRNDVAISNGSACTSTLYSPSHVLKAMGLDDDRIESAVRLSWGVGVERAPVDVIVGAVQRLRID